MALIADSVTRTDDAAGDSFLTFLDGLGRQVQAVAIVNTNSDPMGVTGTPLVTSVSSAVTIDDSTPINVNIASEAPTTPYIVYSTAGTAVETAIISASPFTLKQLRVIMDSGTATDRWLMLFDSDTTVGLAGTAPRWRAFCPAGVETSETFDDGELSFPTTGLTAVISSTPGTYTATGVGEVFFQAIGF